MYITPLKSTVHDLSRKARRSVVQMLRDASGNPDRALPQTTTSLTVNIRRTHCWPLVLHSEHSHHRLAFTPGTMPRKSRSKPLRQHYTRDLKRRVIYQAEVLGYSSTKIAIELSMPLTVVQRVRRTWSEIGEVCRDRKYKGRAPLMSTAAVSVSLHSPLLSGLNPLMCVH
jgi:hypothetical protein